jgi:uncharacterized damage-inducible protein DinB
MISTEHVRLMARYNDWQNRSVYREADRLGDERRRMPRGAFFGSIHGTLSHLAWGDGVWMHRFARLPKPSGSIAESPLAFADWNDLVQARRQLDSAILSWAEAVSEDWLAAQGVWFSRAAGREISKPNGLLVTHFFNHQTHHRGQVHAMLTAAGGKPDDTDLFLMPEMADA